ncbi:MAG: TIGR03746 family integrating conjugative element protein [Herminiimonas sp.]|nr:TIGR03746 family integrating conjugative element protein [Herminiimonas sp.]
MSRYINALDGREFTIRVQWVFIAVLTCITMFAMVGWKTTPKDFTAHIPPDLRAGARLNIGSTPEVPPANVYTFGLYIWQQINRWKEDGTKNYGEQIFAMQNYITPACREQLISDMNIKAGRGELAQRTRSLMEIAGQNYEEKRVVPLGGQAWTVLLDTQLQETSRGVQVKDVFIRYPLQIVRFDVDRELNPFGLAVDCFGNGRPERLDPKAYKLLSAPMPSSVGPGPAALPAPAAP